MNSPSNRTQCGTKVFREAINSNVQFRLTQEGKEKRHKVPFHIRTLMTISLQKELDACLVLYIYFLQS